MSTQDTMSAREAATRLGVSEKTIYRWIESGKLPKHKLGIQHFIPRAAVEALALSRHVLPTSDTTLRLDMLTRRVQELEETVHQLAQELHDIRIVYASKLLDAPQNTPQTLPEPREASTRAIRHTEYRLPSHVPPDAIPLHIFAQQIGVHRRTLNDYVIAHNLDHIAVEDEKRPGTMHRYVTPEQQERIKKARGIY